MEENLDFYLKKGEALHGDICGGIVLGTRLTLAAMRTLEMNPAVKNKNLLVFVEVDRCMADAIQAVTGCSLGHRTLKHMNYGKFGAVFYDMESKRAVRVTERKNIRKETQGDLTADFRSIPDEALIKVEEVEMNLNANDLPGKPEKIKECQQCGELIFDGREVNHNGRVLCRACAEGAYYKPKSKQTAE